MEPYRRLTSGTAWTLAIDTGLGDQPANFDSILIHRFPGSRRSDEILAWQPREPNAVTIPQTAAFADLQEHHDPCGVTELAGKAVGAAFVGVTAACLAIAEALRNSTAEPDTTRSCSALPPRQPGPRLPARLSGYPAHGYARNYDRRVRHGARAP
jgi:hypothetical protein